MATPCNSRHPPSPDHGNGALIAPDHEHGCQGQHPGGDTTQGLARAPAVLVEGSDKARRHSRQCPAGANQDPGTFRVVAQAPRLHDELRHLLAVLITHPGSNPKAVPCAWARATTELVPTHQ